jgi:phosphoribosylaminoimidazole-succinocarboxamide synthase
MSGTPVKHTLLYEGKAKKVWAVAGDDDVVIQEFKNDATAFNGEKRGSWESKGIVNCTVASRLFEYLGANGIKTHFISQLSPNEMLIKKLKIIPLEVIIRNRAAGSFSKRYGAPEGMRFAQPTFEFSYKRDDLGDPLINESHAIALGLATQSDIDHIRSVSYKVNDLLKSFFIERGIELIDFKLEFGWHHDEILLGDEISPDTCRYWDAKTGEKLDKDRFRFDLGNVEDAYKKMLELVTH